MPGGKPVEIGRRSGRFDNELSNQSPIRIIDEISAAQDYRVYNTSSNVITVTGGFTVGARSSVDIHVTSLSSIQVASAKELKGIYDRIDIPRARVRSGRFRYPAARTITSNVTALYRFFNTRVTAVPLTIDDGGMPPHTIERGCTKDIYINGGVVTAEGLGVYDRLDMETDVRSGHFRTDTNIDIADLTNLGGESTYRFFNTGRDHDYAVRSGGTNIAVVRRFSSVDLVLPADVIEVVTGGNPVEGVYDFIE